MITEPPKQIKLLGRQPTATCHDIEDCSGRMSGAVQEVMVITTDEMLIIMVFVIAASMLMIKW